MAKRAIHLIYLTCGILVVIAVLFFASKWIEGQDELRSFKESKIHSRIIGLRNLQRGSYEIELNVDGSVMCFNLPIAYEVRMNSIVVGDSLAKEANRGKFEIFRVSSKGEVIKISESTIH